MELAAAAAAAAVAAAEAVQKAGSTGEILIPRWFPEVEGGEACWVCIPATDFQKQLVIVSFGPGITAFIRKIAFIHSSAQQVFIEAYWRILKCILEFPLQPSSYSFL